MSSGASSTLSDIATVQSRLPFLDINENDLQQSPSFISMLVLISSKISKNGLLKSTDSDLEHIRISFDKELYSYHRVSLVHDYLQKMAVQSTLPENTVTALSGSFMESDIELCSALNECLSLIEVEDMLSTQNEGTETSLHPASSPLLLLLPGSEKHELLQPPPLAAQTIMRLPIAIEKGLSNLANRIVTAAAKLSFFTAADADAQNRVLHDSDEVRSLLKRPLLDGSICDVADNSEIIRRQLSESETRLSDVEAYCNQLMTKYAQVLGQILHKQLSIINDYKMALDVEKRGDEVTLLRLSLKATQLKARVMQLQILDLVYPASKSVKIDANNYNEAVMPALRAASRSLSERHNQLQCQLLAANSQLLGYQQAGQQFQTLAERFRQLSVQLEQKHWLLREVDLMSSASPTPTVDN